MQKGETIYALARSYGVRVQDILALNGITDPRKVRVGQRIKIPRKAGTESSVLETAGTGGAEAGEFIHYQVARGESFYGIARRYGVTVLSLRTVNNLREDYVLKAGDWLRIPQSEPAAGSQAASPGIPAEGTTVAGVAVRSVETRAMDPASVQWPVNAKEVQYMTGKLSGVVLLGERSESVKNLLQGTVVSAGPYRGFGKVVIVQSQGGYLYVYGGCESLSVKEGDRVVSGVELGKLGIDGVSSKPQLFFMVYRSNTPVDPVTAPRA
jgi:murein DD-endopeptidase MepM/ murein hydrolase activator NlpD